MIQTASHRNEKKNMTLSEYVYFISIFEMQKETNHRTFFLFNKLKYSKNRCQIREKSLNEIEKKAETIL